MDYQLFNRLVAKFKLSRGVSRMAGYISYDELNEELQQKVDLISQSDFVTHDPLSIDTKFNNPIYKVGTNNFVIYYDENITQATDLMAQQWYRTLYETSGAVPNFVMTVNTYISKVGSVDSVIQKADVIVDRIASSVFIRTLEMNSTEWTPFSRLVTNVGVQTVNFRAPDENGNVSTDYHIIEPVEPMASPMDYPNGSSEFIATYDSQDDSEWITMSNASNRKTARALALSDTQEPEKFRISVRTHIDKENGVYLQEIDDNQNGYFEATFYRYSLDGINWSPTERVVRLKTINGIQPDENYNLDLPLAVWSSF